MYDSSGQPMLGREPVKAPLVGRGGKVSEIWVPLLDVCALSLYPVRFYAHGLNTEMCVDVHCCPYSGWKGKATCSSGLGGGGLLWGTIWGSILSSSLCEKQLRVVLLHFPGRCMYCAFTHMHTRLRNVRGPWLIILIHSRSFPRLGPDKFLLSVLALTAFMAVLWNTAAVYGNSKVWCLWASPYSVSVPQSDLPVVTVGPLSGS
jgi:hypothetical protein